MDVRVMEFCFGAAVNSFRALVAEEPPSAGAYTLSFSQASG